MLGNLSRKTFLSISNGKIQHRDKEGRVTGYDMLEGVLVNIRKSNHEIAGHPTDVVNFEINDGDEEYSLGVIADSGVARSLVRSFSGIEDFSGRRIRIVTRLRPVNGKNYTNAFVYVDGQQAKWAVDFPKPEEYKLPNGEVTISTKERDAKFWECVDAIIARLREGSGPEAAEEAFEEPVEDDLPDELYSGGVSGMFGEEATY